MPAGEQWPVLLLSVVAKEEKSSYSLSITAEAKEGESEDTRDAFTHLPTTHLSII